MHESPNARLSHAIFSCQLRLLAVFSRIAGDYFFPLRDGQFPIALPGSARHPSFACCIRDVIRLRAKKEMLGVNARWCIATVKNVKAFWDRSYKLFIGEAVSEESAMSARPDLDRETSVTIGIRGAFPDPAISSPNS